MVEEGEEKTHGGTGNEDAPLPVVCRHSLLLLLLQEKGETPK
jgi:hypothetical protein